MERRATVRVYADSRGSQLPAASRTLPCRARRLTPPIRGWRRWPALSKSFLSVAVGRHGHAQQRQPVAPARDLGLAVGARPVPHRQLDDAQVLLGGPEDEI